MPDATPFKFLFVTAVEARQLKNVQIIGKQDPYLKLWVGRAGTKVQTSVDDDGGSSATWGQSFKFSVEKLDAEEYLYFKVKNKNVTSARTIGSGKVAIKTFESSMKGQWYKLYDPNGRDAGEVLMEAKVSRREEKINATGGPALNLPNPTAPMAPGVGGAHFSTQQQSPINQRAGLSPMPKQPSTSPTNYGFAAARAAATRYQQQLLGGYAVSPSHRQQQQQQYGGYAVSPSSYKAEGADGSVRSTENFSPGNSLTGEMVPSIPLAWVNGPTSMGAARSNVPGHRPTASVPSAPAQYLDQGPNHYGGHPRRSSNAGITTPSIPIRSANRPTSASVDYSSFPVPTAPSSLPTPPPQSNFLGPRASPYGGHQQLPYGWEEKVASTGRTFYVDHTTQTTSWYRPTGVPNGVTR